MNSKIKVYYLSTCDTCKRIISEAEKLTSFEKQDIKINPVTENQLAELYKLSGSYQALFSKTARKYKEFDLKNKNLSENDYKNYLLGEYTFLKRPVFVVNKQIFIGNSKTTINDLLNYLKHNV